MGSLESVLVYLGVFAFSSIAIATTNDSSYSEEKNYLFQLGALIGIAIVTIFTAGRYHVGTDSGTYIRIFTRYCDASWSDFFDYASVEWLFVAISKISFAIGGRVLTWGIFAGATLFFTYEAIRQQYDNIALGTSWFVYLALYFVISFNVTREMLAVAIVFWGMKFVYKSEAFKYFLVILIAFGIHRSALVGIVIWFLWDHREKRPVVGLRRILIIFISALAVFAYQEIITFLANNFAIFSDYAGYAVESSRGQNRDILLIIAEFLIIWLLKENLNCLSDKTEFMFTMLIIAVLISFTGFSHPQVKRIAYYFSVPALTTMVGYVPYCFTENSQRIAKGLIIIAASGVFILTAYILRQADLIPYTFDLFSEW